MASLLERSFLLVILVSTKAAIFSSQVENPGETKVECPEGFFQIGTSCYYFSGETTSQFYNASYACRALKPDDVPGEVDLAGLGDGYEEFSYVADFMLTNDIDRMFVGLTGPYDSDDWYWWDGSTLPLYSSMWTCVDPKWSCGGLIIENYELAPRVYISSFDCSVAYASYLCEYTPPNM